MDPNDLKTLPLFESLDRKDIDRLSRWADEVQVEAGKHIVDEGRFAYEFFVIIDGEADVVRGDDHLRDLGPGDFFGELALVETDRRTASVVARTPMRLVVMLGRDFRDMEREMPAVAEQINRAIEERRNR
ncbi:MAG: cyclic nucleotide-binding domain-containing protein [Actinomycetota bacterium]